MSGITKLLKAPGTLAMMIVALALLVLIGSAYAVAVNGNINPDAIQIDGSTNGADLYPDIGVPTNTATADWVKDSQSNTDPATWEDSVAVGVIVGQTGAAKVGHWNGVRVVDGIAGNDQDIFLKGGKENDVTTWLIGPGSVGSSKYDITQAYIANNTSDLFFGMERRGNNGTTAFDFEFNQLAPEAIYTPTRSIGDILFTFEMQGSGGSGSAAPHVYKWNGSQYCEYGVTPVAGCTSMDLPLGLIATINEIPTTAAPWGYVDSHGTWTTGSLDRFEFAEAKAPLTLFSLTGCGGSAYVQVRTRSSSTANSDLKDTTKIFQYLFGGPHAAATLTTSCNQNFTYSAAGSTDSSGGSNITYSWVFTVPTDVTLNGGGVTAVPTSNTYISTQSGGTVNVVLPDGVDSALIKGQNTVTEGGTGCTDISPQATVTVYRAVSGSGSLSTSCDLNVSYTGSATGGKAPLSYAWSFYKVVNGTPTVIATATALSGSFLAPSQGQYYGQLTVTDGATCQANPTTLPIDVRDQLTLSASKDAGNTVYPSVALIGSVTGGTLSGDDVALQWQKSTDGGNTWVPVPSATASTLTYSSFETDIATPTAVTFTGTGSIGTDTYKGELYVVQFRLHAVRTTNGGTNVCSADSTPVTVKKVIGVDP